MNHQQKPITAILLTLALTAFTSNSIAADSARHTSQGSKHSVISAKHLASGAVKVAAGSVAIPLVIVGAIGTASAKTGEALADFAVGDDQPLPIGDDIIVADPSPKVVSADEGTL